MKGWDAVRGYFKPKAFDAIVNENFKVLIKGLKYDYEQHSVDT